MKILILILAISIFTTGFILPPKYIDPTGTYELVARPKRSGEYYGTYGRIRVKKYSSKKILLFFLVVRDTTAGSSGHLCETMAYKNNMAVYGYPKLDEGCKLTFTFTDNGASVFEETPNYSSGCGYSHGIKANGIYRKVSAKVPAPNSFQWW